jgi:hypothetical protein
VSSWDDNDGEPMVGLVGVDRGCSVWLASRFEFVSGKSVVPDSETLLDKMISLWTEEVEDADLETLANIELALNALQKAVHDRRRIVQQTRVLSYGDDPLDLNDLDCD